MQRNAGKPADLMLKKSRNQIKKLNYCYLLEKLIHLQINEFKRNFSTKLCCCFFMTQTRKICSRGL